VLREELIGPVFAVVFAEQLEQSDNGHVANFHQGDMLE